MVTNNTAALIFQYFICLHLMYCEVAWVLVPLGTQVQTQIILKADNLPNYLSFSDDCFYQYYFSSIFNPSASAFSMFLVIISLVTFISFLVENYISLVPYVNKKLRKFS